jgi:hypothetical protein
VKVAPGWHATLHVTEHLMTLFQWRPLQAQTQLGARMLCPHAACELGREDRAGWGQNG